jgi:hypothetical protein
VVVLEIRSNHGLGHVEISGWEIEGVQYLPSYRCEVFAEAEGFQGKNSVYFDKVDLDRFVTELEALDRTLSGTATLHGMSPEEFVLTLRPLDPLGHILVLVTIKKYMQFGLQDYSVSVSYETDQTVVSRIRSEIAARAAQLG